MSNTLTEVIPQLLAQGLLALREACVMPRLVNRGYEIMAGPEGSTIDIPIPSAIAVQTVSPGQVPPSTADVVPTSVSILLDQWKEAPFYLTDKDQMEAMSGTIPMQASEAVKALANTVNAYLLTKYKGIYGTVGVAGTTPFATTTAAATGARTVLNKQVAPLTDRRMVLDPDAEGNALGLRAFQDISWANDPAVINSGILNPKLGFAWHMDQQIPTHTVGTLTGTTGARQALINQADHAIGDVTVALDDTTLTGTIVVGDIFTVAGDTQTYTCQATVTAAANAIAALTYLPAAKVAWADNAELTVKDTHVVNLAFHRDCFAFASRPLADNTEGLGNIIQSAIDPISGLALRLEVSREHKRTRFSYDMLYGGNLVRPELGCRVLG